MIQNIQENTRINTPESHIGLTAFKDHDYLHTEFTIQWGGRVKYDKRTVKLLDQISICLPNI